MAGLVVAAGALGAAVWLTGAGGAGTDGLVQALPSGAVRDLVEDLVPTGAVAVPAPSAEVAALADEAHLSTEGRELFVAARPELLDAATFVGRRSDGTGTDPGADPGAPSGVAVGCYQRGAQDSIVLYRPADERLRGSVVETAAHETLHAGWERLGDEERARLVPLLEAALAAVPAEDRLHAQLAGSVGDRPESRPTELFAYLGMQAWREGGLDPALEAAWGRFVEDRAALVGVHAAWRGALDATAAEIRSASDALVAREGADAQARALYERDAASRDVYREAWTAKSAEVAAMGAAERDGLLLSWTWWDGTELPMAPAEDTLATAADLLARDDAALPPRLAALEAAEAATAAERARVEALAADLTALQVQLDPVQAAAGG
ncbi:hypothetical protein [Cellulomonas marina]|uniref:Uncharacterized protein n=1 Tax=Cellulomonas marina TaxID=988821 RepID=A0A1I0X8H1_9CELL|nr:hypothetical protein [Cellulomonas marina]SFA96650.1 hypothetical protein SAMN05421867_104169 [Cellulomonas marina]